MYRLSIPLGAAALLLASCGGGAPNAPASSPTATPPVIDSSSTPSPSASTVSLDAWNSSLWIRDDGYANGDGFNVGWRADHAVSQGSQVVLTVDTTPCPAGCSGYPYAAGEMRTSALYGYGTYTVSMQTAKGSGIVTTFFTYINMTPGGAETNDEIDVEIPGDQTSTLETTYYKLGGPGVEQTVALPFDSSAAMHTYSIVWLPDSISWLADGSTVWKASGTPATLPTNPSSLILNFWTGVPSWLGPFTYTGPLQASYGSAVFTPATSAEIAASIKRS